MAVSSEIPLASEPLASALSAAMAQGRDPRYVEDEEFPADLPNHYDWMLQPASRHRSRRVTAIVAVAATVLLILLLSLLAFGIPRATPSALTVHSSSK